MFGTKNINIFVVQQQSGKAKEQNTYVTIHFWWLLHSVQAGNKTTSNNKQKQLKLFHRAQNIGRYQTMDETKFYFEPTGGAHRLSTIFYYAKNQMGAAQLQTTYCDRFLLRIRHVERLGLLFTLNTTTDVMPTCCSMFFSYRIETLRIHIWHQLLFLEPVTYPSWKTSKERPTFHCLFLKCRGRCQATIVSSRVKIRKEWQFISTWAVTTVTCSLNNLITLTFDIVYD